MRPYPDEILRSMQYSLDEYVIPNVDDRWGSYVAKVMRRMLVHLERRWELEGPLLVEDSADLVDVLRHCREELTSGPLAGHERTSAVIGRIDEALEAPAPAGDGFVSVEDLTTHNEVLRETLVGVIQTLDELVDQGDEADVLEPLRDDIRRYLRRQVDRDNQLVEPTFMSFSPRKKKSESDDEEDQGRDQGDPDT